MHTASMGPRRRPQRRRDRHRHRHPRDPGARIEFCTFLGGPPKVPTAQVEEAMRGAVADALERIGVTPGPALHFEA